MTPKHIDITTGPGSCGNFPVGTPLAGKFVARDVHFRDYKVYITPNVNAAGVGVLVPDFGLSGTAAAPGDDWNLDTKNMVPCGYTIQVRARDLAIRDSEKNGHWRYDHAGFCLEDPEEE